MKLNYDARFSTSTNFPVNGNPIAVNRIWLPEKFTPQLDIVGLCVDNSLSKTLSQHYGIKILHRTNIVEAVRPSPTEVDLLKITYDTLILQISSTSFTENNVPYEFSRTIVDRRCNPPESGSSQILSTAGNCHLKK